MNNDLERYGAPVSGGPGISRLAGVMSRRLYNAVLAGLIVLSFVVMGICAAWASTPSFTRLLASAGLPVRIACLVGSIGGLILMSVGRSRGSLALGVSGFALFTLTFGFTTSIALSAYSMESVANALLATAGIMAVFGALGMAFPSFFARIQGVLAVSLLAVIVVEVVMMALGVRQNLTDLVVILLFCGFIGYDVYRASTDAPTLENALWYAIEIYLDVVNVMLRLLSIFGNRD